MFSFSRTGTGDLDTSGIMFQKYPVALYTFLTYFTETFHHKHLSWLLHRLYNYNLASTGLHWVLKFNMKYG